MPFCKACGTYYPKSLGVCPTCNAEEQLLAHKDDAHGAPEPSRQEITRRWLSIGIGVPALFGLIYLFAYLMRQWRS